MLINLKFCILTMIVCICSFFCGCAPAVVGTVAFGTYKGATDRRTVGTLFDDSLITAKVKSKLIASKNVSARHIDVDTLKGVVYLSGIVKSAFAKKTAGRIAGKVPGVVSVRNQLAIGRKSAGQVFDDMILASRVKAGLLKQPGIRSLNINVDVNKGTVTLTGIVNSLKHKMEAVAIAKKCRGTVRVIDNLRISH